MSKAFNESLEEDMIARKVADIISKNEEDGLNEEYDSYRVTKTYVLKKFLRYFLDSEHFFKTLTYILLSILLGRLIYLLL